MRKNQIEDYNLSELISQERLAAYRLDINDSDFDLLSRYVWNIKLSQAFYAQLHIFEIFLRNRINLIAISKFGENWLTDGKIHFNNFHRNKIQEAIENLLRNNKTLSQGRIIAELNLGFWTGLFDHEYYNQFTSKIIIEVFPNLQKSKERNQIIRRRLREIRKLRNRIFHFEPIFNSNPSIEIIYNKLIEAISWIYIEENNIFGDLESFIGLFEK